MTALTDYKTFLYTKANAVPYLFKSKTNDQKKNGIEHTIFSDCLLMLSRAVVISASKPSTYVMICLIYAYNMRIFVINSLWLLCHIALFPQKKPVLTYIFVKFYVLDYFI
jgi:hypothetical protein